MREITHNELQAIAKARGRKPSAVRNAVNGKLIHPAQRHSLGRAKGWVWSYPPGTDKALKEAFKLSDRGYRGGALRFQLWWDGHAPFSKWIPQYIVEVLTAPGDNIRFQIDRTVKRTIKKMPPDTVGDNPPDPEYEFLEELQKQIDDFIEGNLVIRILDFIYSKLKGTHFIDGLSEDVIRSTFRTFAASIMRINPENLVMPAGPFLVSYLMDQDDPDDDLIKKFNSDFVSDEWFDSVLEYIEGGGSDGYQKVLFLLTRKPTPGLTLVEIALASMVTIMTPIFKLFLRITGKETPWERHRLGPWYQPEPATKAMIVGLLVGTAKWAQINRGIVSNSNERLG